MAKKEIIKRNSLEKIKCTMSLVYRKCSAIIHIHLQKYKFIHIYYPAVYKIFSYSNAKTHTIACLHISNLEAYLYNHPGVLNAGSTKFIFFPCTK